jgi:hypothetical protein
MLLDSYALRTGFSTILPSPAPPGFTKRVNTTFSKIDKLLKTIQVRASPPEALVQAYLIHIADRNDANFRKVLELKGIRGKQEQYQLIELFQLHRASDRHAPNLVPNNPLLASLQTSQAPGTGPATSGPVGLSALSNPPSTSATSTSNIPARFEASMLGSAIISAARDGVDRFGNQGLGNLGVGTPAADSGAASPSQQPQSNPFSALGGQRDESSAPATNLNENLKNIGKFFRRDLGGFGGRFGRAADEAGGGR